MLKTLLFDGTNTTRKINYCASRITVINLDSCSIDNSHFKLSIEKFVQRFDFFQKMFFDFAFTSIKRHKINEPFLLKIDFYCSRPES